MRLSTFLIMATLTSSLATCKGQPRPVSSSSDGLTARKTPKGAGAYLGERVRSIGPEQAPDIVLRTDQGEVVQLSSLWPDSGLYIVFYRGDW